MLSELCFLLSLFWKNFVCTKAEKSHWVDFLVQENSIKIVIWLTGYFLLRPLMNEPVFSETWLPILEAMLSVSVCRYVCTCSHVCASACVCVCVCVRQWVCGRDVFLCHGFADTFHEERANPKSEWGLRERGREKKEGRILGYINSQL